MANYSDLIQTINDSIKANGNQEITGPVLNAVLQAMVSALGEGYQFMGVATPDTNPGTPDGRVFYIAAQAGVYANFGEISIKQGIAIIYNDDNNWLANNLLTIKSEVGDDEDAVMSQKAVSDLTKLAYTNGIPEFNFTNDTVTFKAGSGISAFRQGGTKPYKYYKVLEEDIVLSGITSSFLWRSIFWDIENETFVIKAKPFTIPDKYYLFAELGRFQPFNFYVYSMNSPAYIVDGVSYLINGVPFDKINSEISRNKKAIGGRDFIISMSLVNGRVEITIPDNKLIGLYSPDYSNIYSKGSTLIISTSFAWYQLIVNKDTGDFSAERLGGSLADNEYLFAEMFVSNHTPPFMYMYNAYEYIYNGISYVSNICSTKGYQSAYSHNLIAEITLNATEKIIKIPSGSTIATSPDYVYYQTTQEQVIEFSDSFIYKMLVWNTDSKTFTLKNNVSGVALQKNEYVFAFISNNSPYFVYFYNGPKYKLNGTTYINGVPQEDNDSVAISSPMMFNIPVDLKKSNLKILNIGNSFTLDGTKYLGELVQAAGIDVTDTCFYTTYKAAATFKDWYDIYNNIGDLPSYRIEKRYGGLDANITSANASAGGDGAEFRQWLNDNDWDIILIHTSPADSVDYNLWVSEKGYLYQFIRLLKKLHPQASLGSVILHSSASVINEDTVPKWRNIAKSIEKLRTLNGFDFIVPYGTAMENIRASSLNTDYNLTRDGFHAAPGVGWYVCAATFYQMLIAPRTGISIIGNTFRVSDAASTPTDITHPEDCVDVTDENALTCQMAALCACYQWYTVVNPDNVENI